MAQSINLIPHEERQIQQKVQIVKLSSLITVLVFFVVLAISGFMYYQKMQHIKGISLAESSIESLRQEINKLSDIEIKARILDQKVSALKGLFETTPRYSILITHLNEKTPDSVAIDTFTFGKEGEFSLAGSGSTYLDVSAFIKNLLSDELFTNVTINSVSLDSATSKARFFIVVSYDASLLMDK